MGFPFNLVFSRQNGLADLGGAWYNLGMLRRVPLVFAPQPEGGFTVTSPVLPELITEGGILEEAYANVSDALAAVIELYAEQRRSLPADIGLQ
jgi:antitoxin HicB